MTFSPNPAMFIAFLETKWIRPSCNCAGQFGFTHLNATSSCNRTRSLEQAGQSVGILNSFSSPVRSSSITLTTLGIMSPAFFNTTVSPILKSCSRMKSSLCNVARRTVDPSINTGSRIAVGVTTPVLPMLNSTSLKTVIASSAGNL